MAESRADLLHNLKHLLELDRGLGLDFVGKGGLTTAPIDAEQIAETEFAAPPICAAPPPAPTGAMPLPAATLAAIASEVAACRACGLCQTRTRTVPGEGDPAAELVFVGEGPGADEDEQGRPFVGKAGELLERMIVAMGLTRDQVYICNVVKCRPPGNRTPEPAEVTACIGYLHRQLATIRPKVICALGNTPLRALTGDATLGITRMRGQRLDYRGTPLIPTFHPAYLLRNETAKKPCWEDLKQVLAVLGRTPPVRIRG